MASSFQDKHTIVIKGGDVRVTWDESVVFSTILGSCVSTCIYDPVAGIGGMNHYLLPAHGGRTPTDRKSSYGVFAVRMLVQGLVANGACMERLEAKVFGGAHALFVNCDIGRLNIELAVRTLTGYRIPIIAHDVAGKAGRHVTFHPASGEAVLRKHSRSDARTRDHVHLPTPAPLPATATLRPF